MLKSVSRVRGDVSDKPSVGAAQRVQRLVADYAAVEDLVNVGAYVAGANADADAAVRMRPAVLKFLQQSPDAPTNLASARKQLFDLAREAGLAAQPPAPTPRSTRRH